MKSGRVGRERSERAGECRSDLTELELAECVLEGTARGKDEGRWVGRSAGKGGWATK